MIEPCNFVSINEGRYKSVPTSPPIENGRLLSEDGLFLIAETGEYFIAENV